MRMKEHFLFFVCVCENVKIQSVYRLIESQTLLESMCHWSRTTSTQCCFSLSHICSEEKLISQDTPAIFHFSVFVKHTDLIVCVPPCTTEERNKVSLRWISTEKTELPSLKKKTQGLCLSVPPSQGSSLSCFIWGFIIMEHLSLRVTFDLHPLHLSWSTVDLLCNLTDLPAGSFYAAWSQSHQQICPAENNQSSELQMITVYSKKDSSDEERWHFSTQTHSDIQQLSMMLIQDKLCCWTSCCPSHTLHTRHSTKNIQSSCICDLATGCESPTCSRVSAWWLMSEHNSMHDQNSQVVQTFQTNDNCNAHT